MKTLSRNYSDYLEAGSRIEGPAALGIATTTRQENKYKTPDHIQYLNFAILDMLNGKQPPRLIIQLPPRHGKSEMVSYYLPVYFIGNNPDWSVGLASYGADLANNWGRRARDLMKEFGPKYYGVEVDTGQAEKKMWAIKGRQGKMLTAGVCGPFTGHGFELLIIDDPVKNMQEAMSPTTRKNVWEWFQSAAMTRRQGPCFTILMMTRWHHDDLAGRWIARLNEKNLPYRLINLPALAQPGDALGRAPGECLWPENPDTNQQAMEEKREEVGTYTWQSLYQGNPSPDEGGVFKSSWWKEYETPPDNLLEIISVDCNYGETNTEGDFAVVQVWGVKKNEFYLLDQLRERADFPRLQRMLRTTCQRWPRAKRKLIEKKANGAALISTLKKEISGLIPINPKENKLARAHAMSHFAEAGQIYLPAFAAWKDDFIEECSTFPVGEHDDQVDGMTQAVNYLAGKSGGLFKMPDRNGNGNKRERFKIE